MFVTSKQTRIKMLRNSYNKSKFYHSCSIPEVSYYLYLLKKESLKSVGEGSSFLSVTKYSGLLTEGGEALDGG